MDFVDNLDNRLNLMTETRFLGMIPTKVVDKNLSSKDIFFNLVDYTIGPVELAVVNADFLGYTVELPAPYVRSSNKTVTFNYVLDSNLKQFIFLYKWISKIVVEEGSGLDPSINNLSEITAPVRVLILSEFKVPVLEIIYEDSYVQKLGEVVFSYKGNADVVSSSFTLKYSRMTFNTDVTNYLS